MIAENWQALVAEAASTTEPVRVDTGFSTIDRATGGLFSGGVWLVIGAPGQGRSTLLRQWVGMLAATHGWAVRARFPNESPEGCVSGLTASTCLIPRDQISTSMRQKITPQLAEATLGLERADLEVITGQDACGVALSSGQRSAPTAVVVDDAHLVANRGVSLFRGLADQGCLVIASAPRHLVVREKDQPGDLRPTWSYGTDVVLEVRTTGLPREVHPGQATFALLRNRFGPCVSTVVEFQQHYARFVGCAT